MQIKSLRLVNYRNIKNIKILPFDKMNVICGENAQGKTNILEAIWLLTGAKSFRGNADSSFINFNEKRAVTEAEFESKGVLNSIKMEFNEKRTAFYNEKPLSNPSKLASCFNAIVFSPADLSIVKDGPDKRRRFLDIGIGQLYPQYIEILKNYVRAVKQRNRIIKELKYDSTVEVLLDSYENEIAENGIKIIKFRKNYIEKISAFMPEIYKNLSGGKENIEIIYLANVSESMIKEMLKAGRKKDSLSGVTGEGPHRDDIVFKINGTDARSFGSQGQKRSIALALKFAGAEVIKEKFGEYPVCLLDDVMSELDVKRQNYILNHIKEWQSFITCCDPASVERLKEGKIFEIKEGEVI